MLDQKLKFIIRCRAIIVYEGKLLVVKHRETDQHYATPGGHIEIGENPLDCIKREIFEEFGVEISNPKLGYIYTWNGNNGIPNLELFFFIEETKTFFEMDLRNGSHAFEIFEMRWITQDEKINLLPKVILDEFKKGFDKKNVKFISN